jgi:hypothetical protein
MKAITVASHPASKEMMHGRVKATMSDLRPLAGGY